VWSIILNSQPFCVASHSKQPAIPNSQSFQIVSHSKQLIISNSQPFQTASHFKWPVISAILPNSLMGYIQINERKKEIYLSRTLLISFNFRQNTSLNNIIILSLVNDFFFKKIILTYETSLL
jgi:hypothetical protein